jgi:hypothetical protein
MSNEQTTDNQIVAELQKLARGSAGYKFRGQLRDRYLNAFRAANKTDNVPRVMYLNGWWELPHGSRRRTAYFIRMILRLEERANA